MGAGQRDFGHDAGPPVMLKMGQGGVCTRLLGADPYEIVIINDQHTTDKAPVGHGLRVGDMVALSPSHPSERSTRTFEAFWRQIAQMDDKYSKEVEWRYGEIRCPVTILWGAEDQFIPLKDGEELA
ncbi:hypothetical protein [Mesorhizobium sp.]|uniref:hypothetical protein n=1 Tax=Mesorhizobium sp. TaxID=1871066 RepID=UPI0025FC3BE1|nr:hypothetical protein [Mesorhizobium sp.]